MSFPQLIPSNPSSPVRQEVSTLDFKSRSTAQRPPSDQVGGDPFTVAAAASSDSESGDDEDVHEVDLSIDSPAYSDAESSSSSPANSPAANKSSGGDFSEKRDVDTNESKTRAQSLFNDLPDWLNDPPAPPAPSSCDLTLSQHTVWQIEDDIRSALDAAASRVKLDSERRERFQQELSDAASRPVSIDALTANSESFMHPDQPNSATPQPPPELLLLMEVVIGEGRSETIEVHVGDAPHELATQFATKHALKPESIPKLTQLIQDNLDALSLEDSGIVDAPGATEGAQQEPPIQHHHHHQQPDVSRDPTEVTNAHSYHHQQQHQHEGAPFDGPIHQQQQMQQDHRDSYPQDTDDGFHRRLEAPDDYAQSDKQERESSRAMNYHNLMAKYGHYTQHSGKVNPTIAPSSTAGGAVAADADTPSARRGTSDMQCWTATKDSRDPLTLRNIQLAEHALPSRRHTLSVSSKHNKAASGKDSRAPQVFDRLYALAESKEKWIRRAQNAKQRDLEKEQQQQRKVEMAAKSRALIAHRSTGGYAHIGERLYDEALSDMAKKDRLREQRALEREHEIDWMCPKCAFANQFSDDVCKNVVAQLAPCEAGSSASLDDSRARGRRESAAGSFLDSPEVICGQPKPEQLFRPTLLATSASVASAVNANKDRSVRIASARRERSQQAIEDEFRQACPFKPTINEVSEEIVRERLENDARAMGHTSSGAATTTTAAGELRRKDPHLALYEDSFAARANRQAREAEHHRQYSFKPDIGVNALWVRSDQSSEDFVERLAVTKYQELERKRQALHDKYAPDRDPDSGREFFKPETGRAPAFNRNERGLPIGDFLHESHREQQEFHRRLQQRSSDEMRQKRQQGFVSEASRQALAARKEKTVRRIFDALLQASSSQEDLAENASDVPAPAERNGNGECAAVTPARVQLARLPREVAAVVPIVFEFANHEPFTCDQFGIFMEKLMTDVPGFTYTQVLFLADKLNDGKSSRGSSSAARDMHRSSNLGESDDDELTFRPVIDKNSSEIAKKHGRADRTKVFDALHQYFEHYKDRKAQIAKQHQREFERLHPFQPQFVAKSHKHASTGFYGKIKQQELQHAATVAAAAPGGVRPDDDDAPPLATALANARPCVRPIDDVAETTPSALGTRSSSGSSSQFFDELGQLAGSDDDADLTSRVLAALDELPSSTKSLVQPPPPPSSVSASMSRVLFAADSSKSTQSFSTLEHHSNVLVRPPESTDPTTS